MGSREMLIYSLGGRIEHDGSICGLSRRAQKQLEEYDFLEQERAGECAERYQDANDYERPRDVRQPLGRI